MYPIPCEKKKTTFKAALCVFLPLYLRYVVMFAGKNNNKKRKENEISTKIDKEVHNVYLLHTHTLTLICYKTYNVILHGISVFQAIFSASHLIAHPYVRIISRFDIKTLPLTFFYVALLVSIFEFSSFFVFVVIAREKKTTL